jgi:hypothetical protein
MTNNLPKRGVIADVGSYGEAKLPPKAERVHGKPGKSDHTAMYLDREGRVQTVAYRLPPAKPKGATGAADGDGDDAVVAAKPRPDVTRKGGEMIGDLRTDALHEALSRAPIEDDTLMALLVLAFAGQNVSVTSGTGDSLYGYAKLAPHAVRLFNQEGRLAFDSETLRAAARSVLIDVLSCRENRSASGIVAQVAGDTIGADSFLPNMGTEEFLSCVSRPALEASCKDTPVLPRARVKDTRAALVEHFREGRFVHPAALFAPDAATLTEWLAKQAVTEDEDTDPAGETAEADDHPDDGDAGAEDGEAWDVAAE